MTGKAHSSAPTPPLWDEGPGSRVGLPRASFLPFLDGNWLGPGRGGGSVAPTLLPQ